MKELYTKPELSLDEFKAVDILTESPTGGMEVDDGGEWD